MILLPFALLVSTATATLTMDPLPQLPATTPGLAAFITQFREDLGSLSRFNTLDLAPRRRARMQSLYQEWQKRLAALDFARMDSAAKADYVLLQNYLEREIRKLEVRAKAQDEIMPLLPFADAILELDERRRRMEPVDAKGAASTLDALGEQLKKLRGRIGSDLKADRFDANRAAQATASLRRTLRDWFGFYSGYDPLFTWWVADPHKVVDAELDLYAKDLREKLAGVKAGDDQAIVGNPVGREALLVELQFEMIPHTPEELIAVAEREYAWCEREMKRASRELGFGDDWKKALEHVKELHVEPGRQPDLIRELAVEAIEFVETRELVTVPALAKETWRMEMMTPERQLVNPFFLGGEAIIVSFPTNTMSHDQKQMSMRGNNRHFARATVQHELIPGHHLQQFMNARNRPYRSLFSTPFWTEGWALYWEMLLWDLNFPKSPEDRVGMLFWRMHRCARIVFSLKFHLGEMTPEECIDYLVEKVGHERMNAEGEVRRSFNGNYGPLYQLAYMIGGLQFRALHKEFVQSGKMSNRQFHDAVLAEHNIPVEILRAILQGKPPTKGFKSSWRFLD